MVVRGWGVGEVRGRGGVVRGGVGQGWWLGAEGVRGRGWWLGAGRAGVVVRGGGLEAGVVVRGEGVRGRGGG